MKQKRFTKKQKNVLLVSFVLLIMGSICAFFGFDNITFKWGVVLVVAPLLPFYFLAGCDEIGMQPKTIVYSIFFIAILYLTVTASVTIYKFIENATTDEFVSKSFYDNLPHNGVKLFMAEETKPYGSNNVTLKRLALYEKNGNRDYKLEGLTSFGRRYSEEGEWKPNESKTYQAVEYSYTSLHNGRILFGSNYYLIDEKGYVYYSSAGILKEKDVSIAFKNGAIAKVRVATEKETEDWKQGKSVETKTGKTITPSTQEEKECAQAGYKDGSEYALVGKLIGMDVFLDLADAVGAEEDGTLKSTITDAANSNYTKKYNSPTTAKQQRLKDIYIQNFIDGYMSNTEVH